MTSRMCSAAVSASSSKVDIENGRICALSALSRCTYSERSEMTTWMSYLLLSSTTQSRARLKNSRWCRMSSSNWSSTSTASSP